ncbi:hypothetical protein BDN72DRAFT_209345 [Pluteus cervinus]|uniref:Uncharacterized protein n=1 Tax=Pluteus cervinus TaxID=181527 RepID=A0ACD3AI03_9AGAR|nr:hypothetical protein BDN72DRAFT_209345 [Pluteus cervinus]
MDYEQAELARQKIDAEIHQLRARISFLASKRNTLAPISRLPPEIMTAIFLKARLATVSTPKSRFVAFISWVCRDWREMSFGCSKLWSWLDLQHPDAVDAFLERSRKARLTITLEKLQPSHSTSIASIINQLPRTKSLSLEGDFPDRVTDEPDLTFEFDGTLSAPNLKVLSLRGFTLPIESLSTGAPLLKDLKLQGCSFSWTHPMFASLTSLKISYPTIQIQIDSFILIISQMPNLSWLTLDFALCQDDMTIGTAPGTPISLPKISSVCLQQDSADTLVYLLERVEFPASAYLGFSLRGTLDETVDGIPEAIAHCRDSEWDLDHLRIARSIGDTVIDMHSDEELESTSSITLYCPPFRHPTFWLQMVQALDLTYLDRLEISEPFIESFQPFWRPIFGDLQNLRVIKVRDKAAYSFLHYLVEEGLKVRALELEEKGGELGDIKSDRTYEVPSADDDDDDELTEEQEAELERFGISFWSLRELIVLFNDGDPTHFDPELVDEGAVAISLILRMCHGVGLRRFVYSGWPIEEELLRTFEEIIPVVEDTLAYNGEGW